ncbi:lipopolysaccharide heptosyltransferase II [bacterium]|nr:lipopolysaccharide heptosyltransferase II [bacterium]
MSERKNNILINISAGIGDALMAEPLVRVIKQTKPDIKIDLLVSLPTKAIFQNNSSVNRIFVLELGFLKIIKLIRQLRKQRYDIFIGTIPSNTLSQVLVPYLSGIPFRTKHRTPHIGSRDFDFLFNRIEPIPEGRHRIKCNLDLLKHVGVSHSEVDASPNFLVSDDVLLNVNGMLAQEGFDTKKLTVGFHPGCNMQAALKRWAPNNYAKLMQYFQEQWNAQLIIVGGQDEQEDVRHIESLLTDKPMNFVGKASLHETAALIKLCTFLISNDSGIMHLATAVGVPVFAIFGPKDERHIGPYGNKHTVIREGTDVNNVSVEKVVNTILQSEYGLKQNINK